MELLFIIHQPSRSLGSNPVYQKKKLVLGLEGQQNREFVSFFFRLSCKVALKCSLFESRSFSEYLIRHQAVKGRGKLEK